MPGPAGRGHKWGLALPEFCFDEQWPSGGVWNGSSYVYPGNSKIYGTLAGMPILPACVPTTCKPTVKASVLQGSVHVQALPFELDAWNATGSYRTMVSACLGEDGLPRCFYKVRWLGGAVHSKLVGSRRGALRGGTCAKELQLVGAVQPVLLRPPWAALTRGCAMLCPCRVLRTPLRRASYQPTRWLSTGCSRHAWTNSTMTAMMWWTSSGCWGRCVLQCGLRGMGSQ